MFRTVRNFLRKYGKELERLLPSVEYQDLKQSYFNHHHPPCERKMRKDLNYLKEKLGVE